MAKTYDFKQVTVIVGGSIISGYAEGTAISIERNEDAFTLEVGADGESTRVKSNNRSGIITLTLQQSSSSNDSLTQFALSDDLSNSGVFPTIIKDLNGTTLVTAAESWIRRLPTSEFGSDLSSREWVIETDKLVMTVGGNN